MSDRERFAAEFRRIADKDKYKHMMPPSNFCFDIWQAAQATPEIADEEIAAIHACLGDDAAVLRNANPDCEIAENMDKAADLIQRLAQATPASPVSYADFAQRRGSLTIYANEVGHAMECCRLVDPTCSMEEAVRHGLAHLEKLLISTPPAEPDMVSVPREPTREIIEAMDNALEARGISHLLEGDYLIIYSAMISAESAK
jgi:hypothetical protein